MTSSSEDLGWLTGGGEMRARIRSMNWSATQLGPLETWPQNIQTALSICLNSRFPILLWLGTELRLVYNDMYIPFLGETKHPAIFGAAGREAWDEIWDTIGPMHDEVAAGRATSADDQQIFFARRLPREEVYVTFGFGPIFGVDGVTVEGVFCAWTETTARVVGERRLATFRDLAVRLSDQPTAEIACRHAAEVLDQNPLDVPFAAIYLLDDEGTSAHLAAGTRLDDHATLFPADHLISDGNHPWPLGQVAKTGLCSELSNVSASVGVFPAGPWTDPVETAFVFPLTAPTQPRPVGFLIVGVSPRRVLDPDYGSFLELVSRHITTSIMDARAFEAERAHVEALAAIDRAKTAFFSNVSHEFRTPLTLMMSPIEAVLTRPASEISQKDRALLDIAHRNSSRLLRLVNTLLDFSRVEAGRVQANYEPVEIAALTAAIASNFRSACKRVGLALEVDCPALARPVYVDFEMWEKIVLNLLSNAFKFTLQGRIGVTIAADNARAKLSVSDTGVGIPQAELPRLFERFHRIEGQQGRTCEGTGIGLVLVRELVRLHGGDVAVESAAGHGTTFTVTIPFGHAHLPADRVSAHRSLGATAMHGDARVEEALGWLPTETGHTAPTATVIDDPAPDPSPPGAPERPRVLLADDNADMRRYVRSLLSARWDIATVTDGQAALAEASRHKPDLVLADIMMPRLDGLAMLSAFRRDPLLCDVPVILLSARTGEEARIEGLKAGADDYLVKPFSARELVARVESRLALARLRAEELASMFRLHELSTRLTAASDLPSLLSEALDAVIEIQGADFGAFQLYDPESDTFEIVAQRGFSQDFLDYARTVGSDAESACTMASRDCKRVIIEDVLVDPAFAPHRPIAAHAGFRAVQSTLLFDDNSGSIVGRLSTHFREPHRPSGRALRLTDLYVRQATDVIAFRLAERRLRESEVRLKAAVELLALGCYAWDPRDNRLVWDSRVKAMWGLPPDASVDYHLWRGAIHPDDVSRVDEAVRKCMGPEQDGIYEVDYRVIGITDGVERWVATRGTTTFANGAPVAFFGVALDVTARKRTDQVNLLLIDELQHRTRNLLTVVQSISQQTLAASKSLDDFSATFSGRLAALSRVQGLVSRGDVRPVTIGELVRLELEALAVDLPSGRVHIEGPDVALPTGSVQILALALHELATNARKYGALAPPEGHLAVTWQTTNEAMVRRLALEWHEHRAVADKGMAHPVRWGFGRTLIEEALPYQLDAETRLEFAPDGVFCSVSITLDS